jgi:hypothetical protein
MKPGRWALIKTSTRPTSVDRQGRNQANLSQREQADRCALRPRAISSTALPVRGRRERLVGGPGVIVQPCAETESRIFDGVEAAEDGPSDRGNDTVPERVCDERCTSGLDHDQPIVAYPWYVRSVA